MSPERWEQIKDVFETALAREASERSGYVAAACHGDESLRIKVERLLAGHEGAGSFLEGSPSSPLEAPLIGATLSHYQILEPLGEGGMGTVYRAIDTQLRRTVAIKVLRRRSIHELDQDRRFLREARAASALNHPNIGHIYEVGEASGIHFIAMEYVEGRTLEAAIAGGPLDRGDVAEFGAQAASALAEAHAHGIIHRDIKPSNLMIGARGELKVVDFGLAKANSESDAELVGFSKTSLTGPGILMGTVQYMSPEQILGRELDHRTDIFSLGLVLYEMAAGHPPFQGAQLVDQILHAKPGPLAQSPELDRIIRRCVEKERERRYQTASELAVDLRKLESGRGKGRRTRGLVLGTAGLLLAAVAGGGIYTAIAHVPKRRVSEVAMLQSWEHARIEKIAKLGDAAPVGGSFINDFEAWAINNHGDLAFAADLSAGPDAVFLLLRGGLSPLPIAYAGQTAPGGGRFEGGVLAYTPINDSRDVAFVYVLKPFKPPELEGFVKAGLYLYSNANHELSAVVVPGVTPAPGFGLFQSTGQHASLNKSGDIVFPGIVRTTAGRAKGLGAGIFVTDRNAHISKVIAPGDPAPKGVFDFTMNPWINDGGDIAFGAHVAGEECIKMGAFGPDCGESIYFRSAATGVVVSIAHQGAPAPGGGHYRTAWGPVLNNRGDIIFMGDLTPPPEIQTANGLFLHSRGNTMAVARPGDSMPGGGKIRTVNPTDITGNYSLNNRGDVSFMAALDTGETGLYVYSGGSMHVLARTGTVIPGLGMIAKVGDYANGGTLNDKGQVFFFASLTDGSGVLLLATP